MSIPYCVGATRPAALALALMLSSSVHAASADCDRSCLHQMLDTYLTAVFKHDPAPAPLAEGDYGTEDAVPTRGRARDFGRTSAVMASCSSGIWMR
jgi:hypothetical protein